MTKVKLVNINIMMMGILMLTTTMIMITMIYDCWLDSRNFHSGREQSAPVAAYTDEDKEVCGLGWFFSLMITFKLVPKPILYHII